MSLTDIAAEAGAARALIHHYFDRWFQVVENSREMWLSVVDLDLVGRDPDIDQIMFEADEAAIVAGPGRGGLSRTYRSLSEVP